MILNPYSAALLATVCNHGPVKRPRMYWFVLVVAVAGFLAVGVLNLVDKNAYGSLTDGVQAAGVVIALGLAAVTLIRDNRDRRVDRVLALHQEMMAGSVWEARYRLVDHLRRLGTNGKVRRVTHEELNHDPVVSRYNPGNLGSPAQDADLLVRYFERAFAALRTDALDVPLFAELIGRHAMWWDLAIVESSHWFTRVHLSELASWTRAYVKANERSLQVAGWMAAPQRDFDPRLEADREKLGS